MENDASAYEEPRLNPVDRCLEILFGLIMAVTIVGSISIGSQGSTGVRPVLAAALGCNLAWGLVDAVMYLLREVIERTRLRTVATRAMAADAASAHLLIREALPASILSITGPVELEGMRQRLLALSGPARPLLDRHDVAAAARIFALVVLATFPVVIPFLLTDDLGRALQASRAVALAMLFVAGWALGRYAGHAHPVRTGMLMTVMGVALVAAVMALGG